MKYWWQTTTIYQIYPRSYFDSNGDGVGDVDGIIQKLDYIQNLGIETIWISPFYLSPQLDHGYDVADYRLIDPLFGTMESTEKLIREVHSRKMKILFDMVMNHTSDQHKWFQESRSSKNNPKRDWYLWSSKPNNWISMIGKPGWNYDDLTKEYYFSNFLPFQPDLNFRNPSVKKEMFDIVKFWLDKGVDGFRLDIFNSIYKDSEMRDNPFVFRYLPSPDNNDEAFFQKKIHSLNHPDNFLFAEELKSFVQDINKETCLLGEVSGSDLVLKSFMGEAKEEDTSGLSLVFQFGLVHYQWKASFFKNVLINNEKMFPSPYTNTLVFGNHDQLRSIERISGDLEKAKLLAGFQLTARGVPVIYYGEEIGMRGLDISPSSATDPLAKDFNWAPKWLLNLLGVFVTRDDARNPMNWNTQANAGFSISTPWLPISDDFKNRNVEVQIKDSNSLWFCYHKLLSLRKNEIALREGSLEILDSTGDLLFYTRTSSKKEIIYCLANFSEISKPLPEILTKDLKLIFCTRPLVEANDSTPARIQGTSFAIWKRQSL
jgi:alpha-glucosidase